VAYVQFCISEIFLEALMLNRTVFKRSSKPWIGSLRFGACSELRAASLSPRSTSHSDIPSSAARPTANEIFGNAPSAGVKMGSVLLPGSVVGSPEKGAMYSAYSMPAPRVSSAGRQGSMFSSGDALRLRTSNMRRCPFLRDAFEKGADLQCISNDGIYICDGCSLGLAMQRTWDSTFGTELLGAQMLARKLNEHDSCRRSMAYSAASALLPITL